MKKKNVLTIALVFMLLIGQLNIYADVEAPSTTNINELSPIVEDEDSIRDENVQEKLLIEEESNLIEVEGTNELDHRDPKNILEGQPDNVIFSNFKLLIEGKELEDGMVLTPGSFKNNKINYKVDWAINPDLVLVTGDYFTFKLPEIIDLKSVNQDGTLQNVMLDGNIIGQYLIENGELIFKLKSSDLFNDVEGNIDLEFELKEDLFEEKKTIEVKNPFTMEDYVSVVIDEDRIAENNSKTSKVIDKEFVEWTINVNRNGDALENVLVEDLIDPALTVIPNGVEVNKIIYNPYGTIVETVPVRKDINIDGQNVKVDLGTISDAYQIVIKTKYNKDIPLSGNEKNPEVIHNHALIKNSQTNEQIDRVASQAQLRFLPIANKTSEGYDMENRVMTWKIVYNSDKRLIKNPSFTDVFNGEVMNFDFDSLVIKVGDKVIDNPNQYLKMNDKGGFDFNYGETKEVIELTYETKIKDNVINPNPDDFINTIELDGKEIGGAKPGIRDGFIVKRAGNVDYENQRIPWTITINQSYQMMNNIVITDTLKSLGHDIDMSSVKVTKITKNNRNKRPQKIENVSSEEYTLKSTENGFELKMKESSDSQFFINFYSTFDTSLIDKEDTNKENDHILDKTAINTANLRFDNPDLPDGKYDGSSTAQQQISDYSLNDGAKFGRYNAETKEITWYLFINANKLTEYTKVYDVLSGNQDFILPLVFEYAKFDYDQFGNLNQYEFERLTYQSADSIITDRELVNEKEFKIKVEHGKEESIVLKYKSSLENQVITNDYLNKAILVNDRGNSTVVEHEVFVPNSGNHLSKAEVAGSIAPFLNWEMQINASQSVLENITIVDTVDQHQSYVRDSLKVFDAKVYSNGFIERSNTLKEGIDYTISFTTGVDGNESFTLNLHPNGEKRVDRPYFVSYQVMYSAPENLNGSTFQVKNDVKMDADSINNDEIIVSDSVLSSSLNSAGAATAKNAKVKFQKVSENGDKLAGVKFEFYYLVGGKEVFVSELTSDENGIVQADKMRAGRYLIKEISTVDGHVISEKVFDEPIADQNGYVTIKTNSENDLGTVENNLRKVQIKKESSSQGNLEGAQFELYEKLEDGTWKLIETSAGTNKDGLTSFNNNDKGILPGIYKVREIKANEGHIINTNEIEFVIDETDDKTEVYEYTFKNHQGRVELTKVDGDDLTKILPNAIFELYHNDKLMGEYVSDHQGKIIVDDLAPGNYYFKEVKAPESYLIDDNKVSFIIEESSDKKIVKNVQAQNYKASIEFIKKNSQGEGLSGNKFVLMNDKGVVIGETESNIDGLVRFNNIEPGTYTIKETTSSLGYLLNDDILTVEVPTAHKGRLVVELDDFINYKAIVQFHKVNEANEPIQGSVFELRNSEGELLQTVGSDSNGLVKFVDLSPGDYEVNEVKSPKEYLLNPQSIFFTVPKQNEGQAIINLEDFVNYQADIEFNKVSEFDEPMSNSIFVLKDQNGMTVSEASSNDQGKVLFSNVAPGHYTIQEIEATNGYLINDKTVAVEVPEQFNGKLLISLDDFKNYQASVQFNKIDKEGKGLSGVLFGLFDHNDELVKEVISDDNGLVFVDGLQPGAYRFKELKAQTGYLMNSEEILFEVSESSHDKLSLVLDDFINYKGSIQINKVDKNGTIINKSSTEFALLDQNKDILVENLETINGVLRIEGLAPGKYYIQETKAPEGFELSNELLELEIPESHDGEYNQEIEFINQAIEEVLGADRNPNLPSTGIGNTALYISIALAFIGMLFVIISKIKRN